MDENTNYEFSPVAQILAIDYEKIKSSQVSSNEQIFQESYKRLKLHNLVEFESSSDDVIHCDKLLNTIVDCYSEDKSLKESLLVEIITIRKYLIDLQNIDNRKYPSIESFVTDIETDNRKGINSGSLSNALVDARDLIANIKLNKIRASQIVGNAGNREIAVKWIESKLIELETPLKFSLLLVLENAKLYNNTLRTIIESGIDNTYISDEKLRIEFHKNELNKRIEHDVQEKLYRESLEKRNFALGNEIKGKRKFTRTFVIQNTSWQRINELAEFNDVESAYEYLLKICQLDTGVKANNILLRDQTEVRKSISNGGQWSYLKLIPKKEYTQVEVSIDLDGSHSAMKTESNVVDINSAKQKTDSELVSDQYKSYEQYIIQNFGQLPKGVIEQIEMDERLNDGEDDLLLELANRLKEERVKSSAIESDQSLRTQNLDLFSGVSTNVNGISIPENNDQEITPAFYQEILESENLTLKYQDALDSIFNSRLVEIRNEMAKRGWRPNDVGPGMNKDISTSTSQATYTMTFSFEKKGAGGNVVKMSAILGGSKIINDDLKKTPYDLAFDITSSITNVMVNGNMTLTYDSSCLGVFTGRVDLSGTTAMHEVLMLEGHEANQKKLVYSSPNENLLVTEQDYDRARELIKIHPELSRNFSIAAANALQNAYGENGLPDGYIARNTLSGIDGSFIDAEWFIEKLTDLATNIDEDKKIKEKAEILLNLLKESHGAPQKFSYKIVPENNGFRLHSLHNNLDQLGLWRSSYESLNEKLKEAISIFENSDLFNKRWNSVRGRVIDVKLHSLATTGVGSELYSAFFDNGSEMRISAKNFLERIVKDEFDATPEGNQAAIYRESSYAATEERHALNAENARIKKQAHTEKLSKWFAQTNYSALSKGKAISVLEKSFIYTEYNQSLTRAEFIERKIQAGAKLSITIENKIKDKSRLELFRMDNEQQRAHDDKVANGGTKEIYWIGNYDVTKTEYEYAQYCALSMSNVQSAIIPHSTAGNEKDTNYDNKYAEQTFSALVSKHNWKRFNKDELRKEDSDGNKYSLAFESYTGKQRFLEVYDQKDKEVISVNVKNYNFDPESISDEIEKQFKAINNSMNVILEAQAHRAELNSQEVVPVTLKNGDTVELSIEPSPKAFSPLSRMEYGEPVSIVAKSNTGAVIGRLTYMPNGGPIDAFVNEGHRRNGVATALYNELEKRGGKIPAANSGFALSKDAEAFRANRNALASTQDTIRANNEIEHLDNEPYSTPALPYENVKTRFSSKSYDEVNHSWLVMNAARPLLGNQHFQGDFLSGRFYVGLDPADEFTNERIEQNIKLDASFVLFATKEEQILIGLNRSEYKDEYLDLIIKGGNERELNPLIEDIRDLPYKEAVEALIAAKKQLNGKSLLEFATEAHDFKRVPQRAGYFPNRYFSFSPSGYTEISELGDLTGLKKETINTIMGGRQAIVTSWSDDNGNGFEVREFQLKEGEELPDTNEKINEAEEHLSTYRILDEKHGKLEIIKVGELDFENVYDATKTLTKLQLNKRGYLEDIYNWLGGSMFPGSAIKGEIVPVDKIRQKLTWVSGADVLKVKRLESANEMSLREPLIIEALIASGKLEKLLSFAGKKSYDTFSDLPNSEKIEAYFKFIDSGEQPIEFSETYNEYAERLEKEALHRRLSSTNQIVQTNGKPFKTEKSAGTFLTEQNLVETHRVEPVEDGFVVVMMPLAYQAEAKRIAEGRESYIEAQESVLRLLGYETNDQGEYEIADREWEQVDRLTESRLNRNAPENTVEKLLSEFNDVGFGMTLRIVDKGLWFVIAKEPYEQGKYRWQSFDETGFIIHKTFDSPEQAIEHAYALGASVIAPFETLDGLAASDEWANSLVSPRQESNVEVDKKLSNGAEDYVDQLQISDTNQEMVQSQIAQTHFDLVLERAAIGRLVNKEKGIVTFIDPDNGIETVDLRQYRQNVFSYEEKIGIQAWVDFSTKKELLAAYEQLVERRKTTHLDSEKNEMLELSNEDKELRTVEIRKVLLPYMTAVGFYSSLSGPNLASVRAQALGVLHNEPKYPLSKSGINALIDDLAIFAGIDLDNTAAGKDSDLSDWIKGAHKTVEEINSNEIQAEVSILAEHDTEREKLAHRYMLIMKNYYTGHSKINDMHYKVADGILNKDVYAIEHIANGMNKALVSFFQEVTGIKLPKTQGGIWDEVLKWAGISKEFDTLRTAKRNYNREKEILLKKFNNGNEVVQMFENHIENGFVELKKIARQMHLYNPKTNQGYNLSSKGTNLAKTQDYVAARLEVYKAELNISLSSKSEANISLIDSELTYKKVGDSWMPDFSHLSSLEGDDLLPHINKLTEDNLHAEAAMLRAMRLKDTSLFERALAYQQHTYKNKCILPEYSTEVSKLQELLSTAEHNLENKLNTCEKSAHIESIPTKEEIPYMHSMEDGKNIKVYSYTTGLQLKNSDEFVGICTGIDTNSFWYIGREFGERTYNRLNAVSITEAYAEAKLKKLSPEYSLESEALQDQITNADYQRLDDRHLNNDESPSTASEYLGFTCYHELADDEWLPHEFYEYKNLLAGYNCLRKFGTPASGFQIVIGRENSDVKSAHSLGECLIVTIDGEFVKSFGGNHQNANETIFELLESDLWASHISKVNLNSAQSKVVLDLIAEGKTFKFTKNSQFFKDVVILNYEENEFKLLDGNGVTHNIEGGNVYKVKELLDSLDSKKEIHWAEASSSSDIALYSLLEKQNHQEFAMN